MITKDDIKPLKRLFTAEDLEDIDMVYRNPTIIECSTVADDDFKIFITAQTMSDKVKAYEYLMNELHKRINILRGEK